MLRSLGFTPLGSGATFYEWAKNPEGVGSSEELARGLIEKTGVVVTPGSDLGRYQGEGFTRLSYAASSLEDIERAEPRIRKYLEENRN
jgi:LL-diaminopimelate aminotransferase